MKGLKFLYMSPLILTISTVLMGCNTAKEEAPQKQSTEKNKQWSYEGITGPEHWGELRPEYKMCLNGQEQSPIDIKTEQIKQKGDNNHFRINYQPISFSIKNNGHSIEGKANGSDDYLTLGEDRYSLKQFHFHTPSEHQFERKHADMELHLVHQNEKNQLAVIGIMIEEGQKNEVFAEMWENLPNSKNTQGDVQHTINIQQLLPSDHSSFRYMGSLTTPPCTEGVQWIVMKQKIEMSKEQIEAFRTLFPTNNRPVQPINGREVF
ncbi:carbonic anhydrase family protein [Bacillus paramycoides]|uniref:carbonic anhydrase n=1 Tax=Bacillus paramycoides TaxID=2026194 RepID=UPI0015BA434D|nr:carbonic anhydrase family protein [Bacillus paramycoides]NWK68978.1 carbonic anhydrase family protein [Bacillus paramycoides]